MRLNNSSLISRREWMKAAGSLGVGAAASSVVGSGAPANSTNALTYKQILKSAPWSSRYGPGCVVFQDRMWVLGGTRTLHDGTHLNDIWSSEDGLHWRQDLAAAPWQPRWGHATFALRDKLWVIGGLASVEPIHNLNDIWSSPDGKQWTSEVADAPWRGRHVWATTVHRGRIYLLGGASDGSRSYQDVISSDDGTHWRLEHVQEPWFRGRKYHAAASYDGKIYLAGGGTNDSSQRGGTRYLNDVWSSEEGHAWSCVTPQAAWSPRLGHALVVYRRRLWLVGGELVSRQLATDIWSTVDGKDWRRDSDQVAWVPRHGSGIVLFYNKVWIMGERPAPGEKQVGMIFGNSSPVTLALLYPGPMEGLSKVQTIERAGGSRQFYLICPAQLTEALEIEKGEGIEWVVEDKHTMVIRRRPPYRREARPRER